jgi:hypothetical protein
MIMNVTVVWWYNQPSFVGTKFHVL